MAPQSPNPVGSHPQPTLAHTAERSDTSVSLLRLQLSWRMFQWALIFVTSTLIGATWMEVSHLRSSITYLVGDAGVSGTKAGRLDSMLWWLKGILAGAFAIQLGSLLLFGVLGVRPAIRAALAVVRQTDAQRDELARLAMVAERTVNGVVITDADARVLWVNRGFTRISGYTLDELRGCTPGSVLKAPTTDQAAVNRMRRAVARGQGFIEVVLNRAKDGSEYWVEIEAQPLYDARGRHAGFMAIETDVTERQCLELALRQSEERMRLATDAASIGVWEWDSASGEMTWSETQHRVLGFEPGACRPSLELWRSLLLPDEAESTERDMIDCLRADGSWRAVVRMRIGGCVRHILHSVRVVESLDGRPVRKAGICMDVTSEHARRAEAERQLAVLERMSETARIGYWAIDLETNTLEWSPEVHRLHEVDPGYVPEVERAIEFYEPPVRAEVREAVRAAAERGEPFDLELPIMTARGRPLWVRATGLPEFDGSGRATRVWGVFQDISELKRALVMQESARSAAEAASEQKSLFLANMSHEIRTPLVSILGYSELLADPDGLPEPERADYVRTIRRNAEHLSALVNDVLDYSKLESAGVELHSESCDPALIVRDVADMFRPRAQARGVSLSVHVDEAVPGRVRIDPLRTRQILVNLIGNAVKFTEQGEIRVLVLPHDLGGRHRRAHQATDPFWRDALAIRVEDTGPGMSSAVLNSLFNPFVQGDPTHTRRHGGTGLGLVISRKLARAMGGDVVARSEPGLGSTFIATMLAPAVRDAASDEGGDGTTGTPATGIQPASPDALDGVRVLLAEDSPDSRTLIETILRRHGASVVSVADGSSAVEHAVGAREGGGHFHMILMDVQMPVMDGHEATRRLRALGMTCPIVALTAHASPKHIEQSIAAGCDDHLTKPIARDRLVEACVRWTAGQVRRQSRAAA